MSLEYIREAVLAQARAEADKILSDARAERDRRLEAARREIEAELGRLAARARQEAEQESTRRLMERRAEMNRALLERRHAILDEVFRRAAQQIVSLPDEQYVHCVESWMRATPASQGGAVLCSQRDVERLRPLIEKLNLGRPDAARLRLELSDRPIAGGVIFRTEKFEIDLSLDARLAQLRQELAPELSRILFGGPVSI